MVNRILWALLILAAVSAVVIGFIWVVPGSNSIALFFMLTAFRSILLFLVAAGVSALLVFAWLRVRRTPKKRQQPIYLGTASALLISCLLGSAITAQAPDLVQAEKVPTPAAGTLRILAWNTDDNVSERDLLKLVEATRPDIIVLPEVMQGFTSSFNCNTTPLKASERLGNMCEIGREFDMNVYFRKSSPGQTLFVSNKLGMYEPVDEGPYWAGFYAKPKDASSTSPKITVAHLQRPEFGIGTSWWIRHVSWAQETYSSPLSIAVGDFNATNTNMRSAYLGACRDISDALGQKPAGTWPTALPAFWGAAIDHVYIGSAYSPIWFGTLADAPQGSQHRPIFAIIKAAA